MPSAESLAGLGIPTLQDTGRSESASVNPADVADTAPPVVKRPAKQKDVPLQQFIVGEGLPAVPAKLVAKIQRGEYVNMAELLKRQHRSGETPYSPGRTPGWPDFKEQLERSTRSIELAPVF